MRDPNRLDRPVLLITAMLIIVIGVLLLGFAIFGLQVS